MGAGKSGHACPAGALPVGQQIVGWVERFAKPIAAVRIMMGIASSGAHSRDPLAPPITHHDPNYACIVAREYRRSFRICYGFCSGYPAPTACTAEPGNRLLFDFDDVTPYYLGCLVTLRRKIRPGFRLVKCHCVVKVVPFDDGHALGSRGPVYLNNPSARGA